jgi:DNA (cytosine-5)-methyltransferase 1
MRCIELFSGAGGLALGLEKAGFKTAALLERDRNACRTLKLNRPSWEVIESDVREIDYSGFGEIDLVAGGPPCQPFSLGGKARGANDDRDMFPEAARAVRELHPTAFMFENVRGLLRSAFANYVEYIQLQLTYPCFPVADGVSWEDNLRRLQKYHTSSARDLELRYNVSVHAVDAADYGVPQRRQRVFFIGFRKDVDARWFFPSPTAERGELLRAQYVTGTYWKEHGIESPPKTPVRVSQQVAKLAAEPLFKSPGRWRTVRDALIGLDEPGGRSALPNHERQPGAKAYPGHTGSALDEPSKALKAGDHGVPGGENMLRYDNGRVRYFTIRESARIQTFPDAYVFPGSWTESMRQIGNAVPVELACTVARSIMRHIRPHGKSPDLQSSGQAQPRRKHS